MLNKIVLHFWQVTFAVCSVHFTLKIIKYAKNVSKNEEKPCSTCLVPFLHSTFKTRNPGFRYPKRAEEIFQI